MAMGVVLAVTPWKAGAAPRVPEALLKSVPLT